MSLLKNIDNEVFLMTCGIITFVSIELLVIIMNNLIIKY